MQFKIHRGTKEIGGSCVEVWTDSSRVVIDFGMPLVFPEKEGFNLKDIKNYSIEQLKGFGLLPDIAGVYPGSDLPVNGLIVSHAHMDHYGLLDFIRPDCKVFLGKATHELINITSVFSGKTREIINCVYFESDKSFLIGDITITPYLMDHSAFDAYGFLIETDGKRVFYSGDFRKHGRKTKAFYWFSHNCPKGVDYLLLEGTSIGRTEKEYITETEIEKTFIDLFKQKKFTMVYSSGQNIDRLVSIYRACKQTGRTFAIDFYTANVLAILGKYASLPFPSNEFPEIKVFFPRRLSDRMVNLGHKELLYRFSHFKITKEEMNSNPESIVMFVRPTMKSDIEHLTGLSGGNFIYSMWSGYLKEKDTAEFIQFIESKGMTMQVIHTSGHADIPTLKEMIAAINPKKIIPIHTFEADQYSNVFPDRLIQIANDKEVLFA